MTTVTSFTVLLRPDPWDGGYTVTVPALPGCVTDGTTIDEALEHAREAIALYLDGENEASLAAAGVSTEFLLANVTIPVPV